MSILNRRNAMLGWLTWQAGKRVARRKARAAVRDEEGRPHKRLIVSALAAAGAAVFFWRKTRSDDAPDVE